MTDQTIETLQILFLEDSEMTVRLINRQLEEALNIPFNLTHANSLENALSYLREHRPDLALIDLNLPDSAGLDTFRAIREETEDLPVIIFSSEADQEVALTAVREGADDYLLKDISQAEQIVRSLLFCRERSQRVHAQREIDAAVRVQRSLLPAIDPNLPGYDISGVSFPAVQTSGDYYDFVEMEGESLGIVLGDASGHGLAPAMRVAQTRAYVRALTDTWVHIRRLAKAHADPGEIITHVNQLLSEEEDDGFVSLLFARLDHRVRKITYASAGHKGFLLQATGELEVLDSTGTLLGINADEAMPSSFMPIQLHPDDILLLPTDGCYEARSPLPEDEELGIDRMLQIVRDHAQDSAKEIALAVCETAKKFTGKNPQQDDLTAVVIKVLS